MSGLRYLLCGVVVALGACATASEAPEDDGAAQEIIIPRALRLTHTRAAAEENCTETWGVCKVGQCELGPHDTFVRITEVCCDANGQNCTTELYRLCGC